MGVGEGNLQIIIDDVDAILENCPRAYFITLHLGPGGCRRRESTSYNTLRMM